MGIWSDFSERYKLNLSSDPASAKMFKRTSEDVWGRQATQDEKDIEIERVDKKKLLFYYMKDPLTFNSVNYCTTITMQPGFQLVGDTKEYDSFFSKMRLYGDNTSLRRLFLGLISDRIAYGAAFLEFVLDKEEENIIDLRRVNPTKIDYARDKKDNLIVNKYGEPAGYVMNFGFGFNTQGKGDPIPEALKRQGINIKNGSVFVRPERIAIFPLYTLPNNYDYIGIIEPASDSISWRRKIQEAQVNAINIKATSPYVMSVGDPQHEPTTTMMDNADNILKSIDESKAISLPYTMKLGTVESKSLDIIEDTIQALMFDQASASGIPLPLLTGAGEATNRSTLSTQREMYEANLQSHVDNFVEDFNMQIMIKLKEINEYQGNAILEWGDIRMESRDEKNKRLMEDIKNKVFAPEEVREYLIDREKIPRNEKKYKEYTNNKNLQKEIAENTKTDNFEEDNLNEDNEKNTTKK